MLTVKKDFDQGRSGLSCALRVAAAYKLVQGVCVRGMSQRRAACGGRWGSRVLPLLAPAAAAAPCATCCCRRFAVGVVLFAALLQNVHCARRRGKGCGNHWRRLSQTMHAARRARCRRPASRTQAWQCRAAHAPSSPRRLWAAMYAFMPAMSLPFTAVTASDVLVPAGGESSSLDAEAGLRAQRVWQLRTPGRTAAARGARQAPQPRVAPACLHQDCAAH